MQTLTKLNFRTLPNYGSRHPGTMGDDGSDDTTSAEEANAAYYVGETGTGNEAAATASDPVSNSFANSAAVSTNTTDGSSSAVPTSALSSLFKSIFGSSTPASTSAAPVATSSGISTTTWLLLGAVAVGGLFLLSRRKG